MIDHDYQKNRIRLLPHPNAVSLGNSLERLRYRATGNTTSVPQRELYRIEAEILASMNKVARRFVLDVASINEGRIHDDTLAAISKHNQVGSSPDLERVDFFKSLEIRLGSNNDAEVVVTVIEFAFDIHNWASYGVMLHKVNLVLGGNLLIEGIAAHKWIEWPKWLRDNSHLLSD